MILLAAVLGWLALLPGLVDATCLVITPYVMEVTSTTAIIRWETDQATTGRLCYKPAGDPGGAWMMSEVGAGLPYPTTHAANVFGLAPETTYEYKVLTQDAPGASDCESDASLVDCASVAEDTGDLGTAGSISQSSLSSMNYLATTSTSPSTQSTLSGTHHPTIDERDLLPFKCRREYLSNRETADDFVPDPFLQFELDLIALLPAACDGEAPVDVPPLGEDDHTDANDAGGGNRKLLQAQGCGGLTQTFKTSPVTGQCGGRFRSWWLGDSGKVSYGQTKNLEAAMAFMDNDWDGTFAIGDNAYSSGTYTEYKNQFFASYCQPFSHVGLYPTLGNHDVRTSNGPRMSGNFFGFFVPGLPAQRAYLSHYSHQHGRVHVVMLDLSYRGWENDANFYAWLEDDLSSARESGDIDWILVANHFPPYSKGSHDSDSESLLIKARENMVPIFEKHGVDVSLAGHSHGYERSHLIHGHHGRSSSFDSSVHVRQAGTGPGSVFTKPRCGNSGVVHVVTGSSSVLSRHGMGHHPVMDISLKLPCSVVIHIEGTMLVSTCVGIDGQLVDRFTIVKQMDPSEGCPAGSEFGPSCESYPSPAPTEAPPTVVSLLSGLPSWTYNTGETGLNFLWMSTSSPPPDWASPSFDDFSWHMGQMPAGFGEDYLWATTLPSNKATGGSYLFRRAFCLTQDQLDVLKSPESSVTLYLAVDDRGSVWLNGELIFADEGSTNEEMVYWNRQQSLTGLQLDHLVVGVNLLAVEVTNTAGSSDAGFDGDLRVSTTEEWPVGEECDLPPQPQAVSILSGLAISDTSAKTGLVFPWLSTSSPPPGWASPSFDDSSWYASQMPAGYGADHAWATVLPSNRATGGSYLFRRKFCLTQDQVDVLKSPDYFVTLYLAADDRGSVWLNGVLVFAEAGNTNHEMVYWNQIQALTGSHLDLLVVGVNLLAVEVTNTRRSSDAGFDGDLRVRTRGEWPVGEDCDLPPPPEVVSILSGLAVPLSVAKTDLEYQWLSTSSPPPDWASPSLEDIFWPVGLMPAGYGSDYTWAIVLPSNRATGGSYLFRRRFCLTQEQLDILRAPESWVTLYLAADNRGSVGLNGELVLAEGGSTNHEMVYWNQQQHLTEAHLELLVVGVNLLAAEVTNDRGSSDAGFDGDLRVSTREEWPEGEDCDITRPLQTTSIISGLASLDSPPMTGLKYQWLSTSSPPLHWASLSFDDISWSVGLMPAGYGPDHTWATALPSNRATGGSYLFRRTFCLTQEQLDVLKSPESSVTLYLASDNRGSVWLNNALVLADGKYTNHEMMYWNRQEVLTGWRLDLLKVGVNLLAVEVTNNRGSSDAGFDGDLRVDTRHVWPETAECDLPSQPQVVSVLSGLLVSDTSAKTGSDFLWLSISSPPPDWASLSFNDNSWPVGLMPAGYGPDRTWATVLPSNRATGGSYLFRRRFCLTQEQMDVLKSPESLVTFYLAADDRGSVWLNGELVFAERWYTNHEMKYWNRQQPLTGSHLDLLVVGVNLVAVEVTNEAGSSDAGFDGDLRVSTREEWPEEGDCDLSPPLQTISILSGLAVPDFMAMTGLEYLWLSTSSPPPDWVSPSFDAGSWSGGLMPAGYGPDYVWATALPSNRATGGSYLFRRTFCLTQEQLDILREPESSVTLYLAADDRGSVWLNGESVFAEGGSTNHDMRYWNQRNAMTGSYLDLLVVGLNLLAVEVTNNRGSSDAGFDGDLRVDTREDWPEGGECDLPTIPQVTSILSSAAVSNVLAQTRLDFLWLSTSSPPSGWEYLSFDTSSWPVGQMPAGYGRDHAWATPLPSNRATGGSYLFRRAFCLTQDQLDVLKSPGSSVTMYLAADNRGSVWLNGEPIFAEGGSTNHDMVYWNRQQHLTGAHLDLLVVGVNLLAVEVTNNRGSSDAGFDGDLRVSTREDWPEGGECDLPPLPPLPQVISILSSAAVTEIVAKTRLDYLWLSTSSTPPGWASLAFDDSAWPEGPMPAGYGHDYAWATLLPSNRATGGSYLFRRAFCLTQKQLEIVKSPESSVTMYLAADNRGSVWLNGELVFAEGWYTNHEMQYWNRKQPLTGSHLDLLVVGVNLLAVEVTNDKGSSDAGFDGDLRVSTREDWPEGEDCDLPAPSRTVSILSGLDVTGSAAMTWLKYLWLSTSSPPPDWALRSFDDYSWSEGPTPAGYGPDHTWATLLPSNRATGGSYLFRRAFCLTQDQLDLLKSPESSVTLYLAADNRGSVGLNGELILAEGWYTNHEMVYWNRQHPLTGSQLDLLEVGVNLLAVEVTNDKGSSDAGFDGDLRVSTREEWPEGGECDLPPPMQTVSILSGLAVTGSTVTTGLRYLWLSASSPPHGWALSTFDDSSWSGGLMPAGYGPDHTWATALPSNRATGGSYLFRRTFCLTQDQLDVLKSPDYLVTLYLAADDRASVWLNGEPIFAEGGSTNHEMMYWNREEPLTGSHLGHLVAGENLLAVEVTNTRRSSDAGFDGDLRVRTREEWPVGEECDIALPFSTSSSSFIDISDLSALYAEVMAKVEMVKSHVSELVESLNSASADPSFLSVYALAKSAVAYAVLTSVELGHTLADEAAVSAATIKEKTDQELRDILSRLDGFVSEAKSGASVAMNAAKAAELAALARDFAESVAGGNVGTASTVMAGKSIAQLAEMQSLDASVGSVSAEKVQEAVSNNIGNAVSTSVDLVQTLAGEVAVSAATIKEKADDEVAITVAMNAAKAAQMAALARDFAHSVMAGDAADKGGITSPVMTGKTGVQLAEIQSLKASVESVSGEKLQEAAGNHFAEAAPTLESTAAIPARGAAKIAASAALVSLIKADKSLLAALQKAALASQQRSGDNVAGERSIFAGSSKSSSVQSRSGIAAPEFAANMDNLMADLSSQLSNLEAIQRNLGGREAGQSAAARLAKKLKSNRKYLSGSTHQQETTVANLG